ncbi:MAG: helix-turn-helix domain-containing protein, partial [Bdellovibrionota bacterium]
MLKHGSRHYSELLNEAFAERKAKNPSYSLRAFARYLAISAAALSQVLSRKRDLSKRNALKVAERLGLSPLQ